MRRKLLDCEPRNTKEKLAKAILDIITVIFIELLDQIEKKDYSDGNKTNTISVECTLEILSRQDYFFKISELNTDILYNVNIENAYNYILRKYFKFFIALKDPKHLFLYYLIRVIYC